MLKKGKKVLFFIVVAVIFFIIPVAFVSAFTFKSNTDILIGQNEVIKDNFIAWGDVMELNGTFEKDVIVGGGNIKIKGKVLGDIIAIGGNIDISAEVEGNVRVLAKSARLNSKVGKNVNIGGSRVVIDKDASVGWSVLAGAVNLEINGDVNNDIHAFSGNVILDSNVGGNVYLVLEPEGNLVLNPKASIAGNLDYNTKKKADIKEGAGVAGKISHLPLEKIKSKLNGILTKAYLFKQIVSIFGLLVVGSVLISVFKKPVLAMSGQMLAKPWPSLGYGILYFFLIPFILLLLAITIIGIPLSLIGAALYLIFIYVANVFVGVIIGLKVIRIFEKKKKIKSLIWPMILGIVIFVFIAGIPYVGLVLKFLGVCWALGAIIEVSKDILKGFSD